jgi:hypothetical protein
LGGRGTAQGGARASIEAAREARRSSDSQRRWAPRARARALGDVPGAAQLAGLDLAEVSAWAAELAVLTGAAPRAVELGRQAVRAPRRRRFRCAPGSCTRPSAATCCSRVAATRPSPRFERGVELVPPEPPSPEARAGAGRARARADADLAPRRVAADLRAGARARPCRRPSRGRGPGACGVLGVDPRLSRPTATMGSQLSGRPLRWPRRRERPRI